VNQHNSPFASYSEQDTADKLILPYLVKSFGFPAPSSLDYQAQHLTLLGEENVGRYDGLYLSGGFPYAVLEAKRYNHDLNQADFLQARSYATSDSFDYPVPFLIVSNGREHRFYKRTETIDPGDGKLLYQTIPSTSWNSMKEEKPGEVRRLLDEKELVGILLGFKQQTALDISALFIDPSTDTYNLEAHSQLGAILKEIIEERRKFIGDTGEKDKAQTRIRHAIEAISLHFTTKILFIKLIEDLSAGSDTPRVIHTLFPRPEYDLIGGLFGFKVLNALNRLEADSALRTFSKSKRFYKRMGQDIAKVSWQDIFRYGFSRHSAQYGKLFKAANYDRFLPSEETLAGIRNKLITIDIRWALLYGSFETRLNMIGRIYERLIDDELRNSIGAIYTPDSTMRFMVDLGRDHLKTFRGKKIVEPSCGSGHFYRQIYRDYVDEVLSQQLKQGLPQSAGAAHSEAQEHVYGRDIDPFAVQLTLLSTFLEQLRDNVQPLTGASGKQKLWKANRSIDTQNSLDPITIEPDQYFDVKKTSDLAAAQSRRASCRRAYGPELVIGNPPYGVSVVEGDHYSDVYKLGSKDSYGYFIVNALKRLKDGGRVVFIVSSSFLTVKTHLELRRYILSTSRVIRVIKLSRSVFPGIDVFPAIIELEKCDNAKARLENVYQFFDFWQLHPVNDASELETAYKAIRSDHNATKGWPFLRTRTARYTVRQGLLEEFSRLPIFEARPSLFPFMKDVFPSTVPKLITLPAQGGDVTVKMIEIRGRTVVKLTSIAEVKIGLQSGDNPRFYRAAKGVTGGAAKGGYKEVDLKTVVDEDSATKISEDEQQNGIVVNDPSTDRYFLPLDKAAKSDIESGLLALFWRPVEFYVDWSRSSVEEMKRLPGARFQGSRYYFRRGVSFSNTGIYSPTFRLSHGGVFDQTGSCIFSDVLSAEVLLGLLSSTLMKYFAKSFINHGAHAQLDDLPIVIPTPLEVSRLESKVSEIVTQQKANHTFDYRPKLAELDDIVFDIYKIEPDERKEVSDWYIRHYPKLFDATAPEA
jgi:type I restriction-modification system DNA methylase subunit